MQRSLLVALAAIVGALSVASSASAFTTLPVWKCRASPLYASVNDLNRVEPIVANGNINTAKGGDPDHAQCARSETGAGNTATQLGIPQNFIGAQTTQAKTDIVPELGRAIDQKVTSTAKAENVTIQLPQGGTVTLGVKAATSSATGSCVPGTTTPKLDGTSQLADVTLGGTVISLDRLVDEITKLLKALGLDPIVEVKVNEKIVAADSLTVRALHVKVLTPGDGPPLVDAVVAESKVAVNGPVCDPKSQNDGSSGTGGSGGPKGGPSVCPKGAQLDIPRSVCVIPASSGSSFGAIDTGRPFQGPSGGTVVPLDIARKQFGASPCLGGSGAPKFAIIGTNGADRITGTNIADRIIGLGGNDRIDGGRGDDCLEGRTGGDNLSGGLGDDRVFGASGNDHLNGGSGTDQLSAGSGNDTINASFGRDRALGGDGRDFINIATAGPAASADCGAGPDKVRINKNERGKVRNCETVYVFNDR